MGRIEAIIFDKDGTLFDFQTTWSVWARGVLRALAAGDEDLEASLAAAIGYDPVTARFRPSSVVIAGTSAEVAAAMAPVLGRSVAEIVPVLDRVATETPQEPVAGLSDVLEVLARDHVLGLITNDSEVPARAHLEGSGIAGLFAYVAGYDSGHGAKPDPGPLLAFSRATGTDPGRTIMVGDSRHDLVAGRAAGMGTVAVLTGVADVGDLADLADAVLPDIGHLGAWIAARD